MSVESPKVNYRLRRVAPVALATSVVLFPGAAEAKPHKGLRATLERKPATHVQLTDPADCDEGVKGARIKVSSPRSASSRKVKVGIETNYLPDICRPLGRKVLSVIISKETKQDKFKPVVRIDQSISVWDSYALGSSEGRTDMRADEYPLKTAIAFNPSKLGVCEDGQTKRYRVSTASRIIEGQLDLGYDRIENPIMPTTWLYSNMPDAIGGSPGNESPGAYLPKFKDPLPADMDSTSIAKPQC